MITGISSILCIGTFVVCAFLLRRRMRLHAVLSETRMKAMLAAEAVLLHCGTQPDLGEIERAIERLSAEAGVMRGNALLFRLLWPEDYDRALRAGERLIAQHRRLSALHRRLSST